MPAAQFTSQEIVTNNDATTTPPVNVVMPVPAGATYLSANATQGSCSEFLVIKSLPHALSYVRCALGPLAGNGASVTANLNLKVTAPGGGTVTDSATVAGAAPPVSATQATSIYTSGSGGSGGGGGSGGNSSGGGGGAFGAGGLANLAALAALAGLRRSPLLRRR